MNPPAPPVPHSSERLELLRSLKDHLNRDAKQILSPFGDDAVVRYRTDVAGRDVETIHHEARKKIGEVIHGIHAGNQSQVVLIAGDPGMGKSHLINHFRHPERAREQGYVLACNANSWRVSEFKECLLDWLLNALTRDNADGKDLLLAKVHDVAFQALALILATPGQIGRFERHRRAGFLRRLLGRSFHARCQEAFDHRDPSVFRSLHFQKFAAHVCDRFLAESGNPFHRYLLHVLLCYLFEDDREQVVHWLRGRQVGDHFLDRLGVKEVRDHQYKIFDTIKVLVSFFSGDVTRNLAPAEANPPPRGTVFFFAFDQMEACEELFEDEKDWFKFFAQLSEIYNALPNVFILFTMTLGLRNRLHPLMEGQFKDRIRNHPYFVLQEITDDDTIKVYQQRLHYWLRDAPRLLEQVIKHGNPCVPFTNEEVTSMSRPETVNPTVRGIIRGFDERFRRYFEEMCIAVKGDYTYSLKDIRATEQDVNEFNYVKNHLDTVCEVFNYMGDALSHRYQIHLDKIEVTATESDLPVLRIQFSDPDGSGHWIRILLVRLGHRNVTQQIKESVGLLWKRPKDRYQLWLVRHPLFDLKPEAKQGRDDQVFGEELPAEVESILRAAIRICSRRDSYPAKEWEEGEEFLLDRVCQTYLGRLFNGARNMLQGTDATDAPEEEADLHLIDHKAGQLLAPAEEEAGAEEQS